MELTQLTRVQQATVLALVEARRLDVVPADLARATAERLGVREIATFDRRHFLAITPKDGGHFTLLPESL